MKATLLVLIAAACLLHGSPAAAAEAAARQILDANKPAAEREALIAENLGRAAAVLTAMTSRLPDEQAEEYRRIPWIWRLTVAVGKQNRGDQIAGVLDVSLPKGEEPLRHWQAVVIGGGIIHGLSQQGVWPGARVAEILQGNDEMNRRWDRALHLAAPMADDEKAPTGTRYDALRMIALQPWEKSGAQLSKYLGKGVHDELQQGAVSGLSDMKSDEAAEALIANFGHFSEANRKLAVEALQRDEQRREKLREAVRAGRLEGLAAEDIQQLNK